VTREQMIGLFDHTQKREAQNLKFQLKLHGFEIKTEKTVGDVVKTNQAPLKNSQQFIFRDPEEYKKMPQSEREDITKKMLGTYKQWAGHAELSETRDRQKDRAP